MRKRLQRLLALSAMIMTIFVVPTHGQAAGWVDDWISQRTHNPPNYFAGQKRGYYSGGSFSARWPSQTDLLVSAQAPRLKSGCGGLDLFMGGFSFMNFEYLVEKLQRVLMSGGAVAFDIALKTLCEPCASTIKSLDALANQLNSMQFDECKASDNLVTLIKEKPSMEDLGGKLSTALKENQISQGISDLFHSITERDQANQNVPQQPDLQRAVSGCDADLRRIFLSNSLTAGGNTSLLKNLAVDEMGMPETYANLVRGLVGDIEVRGVQEAFRVGYVTPCPDNEPGSVEAFTDGKVYAKNTAGACSQITDANRDLVDFIATTMVGIAGKIRSKGVPTAQEISFLESNPLNVSLALRQAVATEMEGAVIGTMSELTAKAYVMLMLEDLYGRSAMIMLKAREVLAKKAVAAPGQDAENCQADIFAVGLNREVQTMLGSIAELRGAARQSYAASAQEANTILDYVQHMRRTDQQVQSETTRRFGAATAQRISGR